MLSPTAKTRVLVVDDQPVVAMGLTSCLVDNGFDVCGVVADVLSLVSTVELSRPGLIVIEAAGQNQADLYAAVADLVVRFATPVLAFTSDISLRAVDSALESGCLGVVPRTATVEAFIAAAHAVAAGERHLHGRALAVLLQRVDASEVSREMPALSARELGVLALVAEGFTNARIGDHLEISPATVKTHVENMLHKLNASDRAQAVSRAMRLGMLR